MDNNILASLDNIQKQTANLNKVAFCFQPWIEFNNLGVDGFRIPAVQSPTIPRLEPIPLVSIPQTHIESRKSGSTNKYVPLPVHYQRSIASSYIDLLQRYGQYGLVFLEPMSCTLHDAMRRIQIFELMMEPFNASGVLEDLPAYFGIQSPIHDQLENPQVRVKTNALAKIKSLVTHMHIDEVEADILSRTVPILGDSAARAHRKALDPSNGILPQSIDEINKQKKPRFDQVDVFLRRQFPGYNSDSVLTHRSGNDGIAKLTTVLETLLRQNQGNPQAQAQVQAAVEYNAPQIAHLMEETVAPPVVIPEPFSDSLEEDTTPYAVDGVESTVPQDPNEEGTDTSKCIAIANSGKQCKLNKDPEAEFPEYCGSHQEKARRLAIDAAIAATA